MTEILHRSGLEGDILIIDDEPDNLDVLSTILECYGYQVRQAVNADIALKTIKIQPPDLILLDVIMPRIDGYQLCEQLKSNPDTKDIPVIFLSALSQDNEKGKGYQVGAVDFISKPFHLEEILARIKHQLTIRRQQIEINQINQKLSEQNYHLQTEIYLRQQIQEELKHSKASLEDKSRASSLNN